MADRKDVVRLVIVVAVAVAAAAGFVSLAKRKGYGLAVGQPAPPFELPAAGGRSTSLASLRGQVVLLNLWASWCPPCLEEMPALEQLHRQLKAEGLVVLGISADEEWEPAAAVVQKLGITFSMLHDPREETSRAYRVTGYPETFLVDRRGRLREIWIGPVEWTDPALVARLREVLGES